MAHATKQHPNAQLTPKGRRRMVGLVVDDGWTIEATADRFQVDPKTVRKWRDRFLAEGEKGLLDPVVATEAFTKPNAATGSPARDPVAKEAPLGRRAHRARGRSRTVDRATHPSPGWPRSP